MRIIRMNCCFEHSHCIALLSYSIVKRLQYDRNLIISSNIKFKCTFALTRSFISQGYNYKFNGIKFSEVIHINILVTPDPLKAVCDMYVCVFPVFRSFFWWGPCLWVSAHLWDVNCSSQIACLLHPIVAEEALFNHPDSTGKFFRALHRLRGHYLGMSERKWSMGF